MGYSRLLGADEAGNLEAFKTIKIELFDPMVAAHHGRLVKTTGDGFLVEFGSVVDALCCATELQAGMARSNAEIAAVGINAHDVVLETAISSSMA